MITGSLPFVGADALEVMDALRRKEPVSPSDRVKVPADLETICLKCLRKDPPDRYASAQALADDLRAFQEDRSIAARPMSRVEKSVHWVRKNPSWAAMITAFVLAMVVGTGVSLLYAGQANEAAERALRPAVLWRNKSQSTRSDWGSRYVATMLSVAATCKQQGRKIWEYLTQAFATRAAGQAPASLLQMPCTVTNGLEPIPS